MTVLFIPMITVATLGENAKFWITILAPPWMLSVVNELVDVERELVVCELCVEEEVDEIMDVLLVEDESPSVLELTVDVEVRLVPVDFVEAVEVVACVRAAKVSADATIRIPTITNAATSLMERGVASGLTLDRLTEMTATIDKIQAMKMSPSASGTVY